MKDCEFEHQGLRVHYMEGGDGFPILMIHGSGPGASTIGNWRAVLGPMSERFHVYAMDLIGFGKSARKPAPPYFDFPLWLDQCQAMLDRIPGESVGVIGHSISGALALKLAASNPRITKVMTTGSIGAPFTLNEASVRTWTFPRNREELRLAAEGLIYDKSLIDEAYLSNRESVLFAPGYEQYFNEMFGGDKRRFVDAALVSPSELDRIRCDVLMIHGRDDKAFPADVTMALSRAMPHADVVLLGRCSHSVAFEHPKKFISLATSHFS
jgi:2-hydroxymuconate-semialdehyde hydrolase